LVGPAFGRDQVPPARDRLSPDRLSPVGFSAAAALGG
jgi:hypothetical protein